MTPAEFLREAAAHIDRVGLNQDGSLFGGEYFTTYEDPRAMNAPCCIMGALTLLQHRTGERDTCQRASQILYVDPRINALGTVAGWNDLPTTTKADAIDLLLVSAERAEEFARTQAA